MNKFSGTLELDKALTEYYMPFAMKVIVDRALPDCRDGLKPIARRIMWTLWNNGVKYNTNREKSGKIVGDVLKIHNHGDISVYNAMALLTEQNEGLLHPFIDGGGTFGKVYSNDSPSAMRYTSVRLNKFSEEMFKDIGKNTVKFIGEDKSHLQPLILTNTYCNLLVKPNLGVAVGEACNWASFNLSETCTLSQAYIKDKSIDVYDYIKAPDFSTGSYLIISKEEMKKIINTGKGKFRLRGKYRFNKERNTIEIYEIPYNANVDDIIKDVNNLMNSGLFKDIIDIKDETGFDKKIKKEVVGIGIEVKKNSNIDSLMKMLFKKTRLETSFSCNHNCLVDYKPKLLGIKQVLDEWIKFRISCIKSAITYDIDEKEKVLHYLKGLEKVLVDIDKAIDIIRHSKNDDLIISNLVTSFDIDETQANELANMKLRNINEKYILNKIKSINGVEEEVANLKANLNSEEFIEGTIISQLEDVKNKYGIPRKSEIINGGEEEKAHESDLVEDYNPNIILTSKYIKKTRKYSDTQKLTEDDIILQKVQCNNKDDLILITNQARLITRKVYDLQDCLPSEFGTFMTTWLGEYLQKDEKIIHICASKDWSENLICVFENGNISKMSFTKFKPVQNRLVPIDKIYNSDSPLISLTTSKTDIDILLLTQSGHGLAITTEPITVVKSKNGKGVVGMKLDIKNMEDDKLIYALPNVNIENSITLKTEKGKEINVNLSNISPDENKNYLEYISGKRASLGIILANTRKSNDKVISVDIIVNK